MAAIQPFSDEQARALVNLRQRYEVWSEAERALFHLPYDLRRKTVGGRDYLYEIRDRSGNGKSFGAWDDDKAARFAAYKAEKTALKQRRDGARAALGELSRLARALRLPLLSSAAGPILREADRRGLLGSHLLVVGTDCIAAYAQEAAGTILGAPDETEDFDLACTAEEEARTDRPRPFPLPEQEWLLLGRPVDQLVPCRDGSPARIVAPDPRWFALHKLWMAEQAKRNPLKRPKDRKQGLALLDAVAEAMPHYPLDADFASEVPEELRPMWEMWESRRPTARTEDW